MAYTLRLAQTEIKTFLVGVVKSIFTKNSITTVPVITSHQDAPAPAEPYITISYSGDSERIGRGTYTSVNPSTLKREIIQDNQMSFTITEEGGDGSLLNLIRDWLEEFSIQSSFQQNQISLLRTGNVVPAPALFDDDWTRRSTMTVLLGIASGLQENVSFIEDVNINEPTVPEGD